MARAPAYLRLRRPALLDLGPGPKLYYDRRLAALQQERRPYEQEWREISEYIRVRRLRLYRDKTADTQRPTKRINSTATIASRTLRSGLYSGASSPSSPWIRFTTPDRDLADYPRVKEAYARRADKVSLVLQKSNFYSTIHESYGGLGDFGNSCELIEDDYEDVIRLVPYVLGEYYYSIGVSGRIDGVYRELDMRVSEMVDRFKGNVSPYVMNRYDQGNYNDFVPVVHAIESNRQIVRGAPGLQGRPWVEVYYEPQQTPMTDSGPDQGMLSIGGYKLWPLMAGRWDILDGSPYGFGPGLECIDDVKGLQSLEFRKGQIVAKLAVPTMRAPNTAKRAVVDHSPGAVSYYDPVQEAANAPQALYHVQPQALQGINSEITFHENRIDRAYFGDVILMISRMEGVQPRNELEISERNGERFLQFGPVLDRLHSEKLNVAVQRAYQRCEDVGLFDPLPPEAEAAPVKIEYISILAQAQKAAGISGIERVAGFVGRMVSIYPEVRHKLDPAQIVDEYGDMLGVRPSIIVSDDEYQKSVDAESQQKNAMAAAAAGRSGADAAKVLAETDTTKRSALTDLIGQGVA